MTVGLWFAAKSPTCALYPCRCWEHGARDCGKSEPWGCPCWGRRDLFAVPQACCGRRNLQALDEVRREAQRPLDVSLGLR